MRVTNTMISNSARNHVSRAKSKLLTAEEQYTTEKKIQRPSDDPTIAVRSLKYRGTMAQITQYVEKNVKDAMSWMDTTQGALDGINSILIDMKGNLDQGANDYLAMDERNSVLSTLKQYVSSVLSDNANADYSGRYVFTGYRTDTSLLFGSITKNLSYEIRENFVYSDVGSINVVTGGASYTAGNTAQDYVDQAPKKDSVYRMQLAYKNCSNSPLDNGETPTGVREDYVTFTTSYSCVYDATNAGNISFTDPNTTVTDADTGAVLTGAPPMGTRVTVTNTMTATTKASTDKADATATPPATEAYDVGDDELVYLYDTGEILMGKNIYSSIQQNKADITVDYVKTEFDKQDIRPEMYFKCKSYDSVSGKTTKYSNPAGQDISYEVNFSQTMRVNTQGLDAISTEIYRAIDYLTQTIEAMDNVENQIADVEKMIANAAPGDDIKALEKLKETLETEKSLRMTVMTEAFGKGLTMVDNAQEKLNVALANLGTRRKRLELTYDKLSDQYLDTEEQLSNNEDIDIYDAFVNLTQADNLYQYSLSSTSKILGNTLLDYI